jgi:co-chaperonin GroES (HSP10)
VSEFSIPKRQQDMMDNPSGIQPVEYKCLVKPYHIMDTDEQYKSAKEAGIIIAEQETQKEQYAQVIALLVAVGGNAFEDWKGRDPVVGDRVMMAKYAGVQVDGMDGRKYRLVSDKDIAAVLFKPEGLDPGGEEDGSTS